jgi:hypothetical protein
VYTETFVVCWRCTEEHARHLERWTAGKGRKRGPAFYDHVATLSTAPSLIPRT